jgi:activator of Hsp90 ATPase-like protein
MFGGVIVGRNVELLPNERIAQAWRPAHWDPGVYSIVRFELKPQGSGTKVVLDHTGFLQGDYDHLEGRMESALLGWADEVARLAAATVRFSTSIGREWDSPEFRPSSTRPQSTIASRRYTTGRC